MRVKFWRWAHDRAEALWHWIYYHRVPEGIAQRAKAESGGKQGWTYSFAYVNSKGEIAPNSDGIRIFRTGENKNG